MPCPELAFTGLNRFWAVREQYDTPAHRRHCQQLAAGVADVIAVHVERGEDVVLVGIEGSPSMGVCVTSSDAGRGGRPQWPDGAPELTSGEGIFIEELRAELGRRGLGLPRVAGMTHPLPSHDAAAERAGLAAVLEQP
jgi:predicted secreted protein